MGHFQLLKQSILVRVIFALALLATLMALFPLTEKQSKVDALPAKPNILIVLSDDQGCDQHTSVHCDMINSTMKFLASEPGGHWITSLQTRTHGSLCCPNRATILTGQTIPHHGQYGNSTMKLNENETLATAMRRGGYKTGLFGKYLNTYNQNRVPVGWDRWIAHKGAPAYYNFDVVDNGTTGSTSSTVYKIPKVDNETYDAYWLSTKMNQWINDQSTAGQPWMAYFAAYAPHSPGGSTTDILPGEGKAPKNLPNWKEGCLNATDPDISDKPTFVQAGDCSGSRNSAIKAQVSLDHAFKRIYDNLAANGQLDNTIIFYMGDNGMALSSHRLKGKQCPYEECHTTPFMVRLPDRPSGTVNRMVSNLDVMPTILELTGSSTTLNMDGRSIVQLLNGDSTGWRTDQYLHEGVPTSPLASDYEAVRDDCQVRNPCMVYIEHHNGERQMFNLTSDPYQLTNLLPNPTTGYAGQPGWDDNHPEVIRMKQSLTAHLLSGS